MVSVLEVCDMAVELTQTELLNKISQNDFSYRNIYLKNMVEVDEDVEKLQDNIDKFKKSAKWLKKYSAGASSPTRLAKEIKSLIKSYNDMNGNAGSITDKDIQKQMSKLSKLFSENDKNLKKVGIEKVNGKYVIDNKKYSKADDDAFAALFEGHDSFINKADKILSEAQDSAEEIHYNKVERKIANVTNYDRNAVSLATFMTLAQQTEVALSHFNSSVQSGNLSAEDEKDIKTDLMYFAISAYKSYNGKEESGNLIKLNKLCRENEEKLNKIGITFDDAYSKMSFAPDTDLTTEEFKQAYNDLFGENAEFGKKVSEYAKNVFQSLIKPDKIGVSIIDISI